MKSLLVVLPKALVQFGCLFLLCLLIFSPASAQTVQVRLWENFHPTSLEINLATRHFTNDSSTKLSVRRDQNVLPLENPGRLMVFAANDTLFPARGIRISLVAENLKIQSDGFNRSWR